MIFEAVQLVIKIFSMPLLYAIVAWFLGVGFVARMAMMMVATKVKKEEIITVCLRMHILSLIIAYVASPFCSVITTTCASVITGGSLATFPDLLSFAMGLNLYIWYSVLMIMSLRYLLCKTFVAVSCRVWQMVLIGTDSLVAILGYIFLSALHLL